MLPRTHISTTVDLVAVDCDDLLVSGFDIEGYNDVYSAIAPVYYDYEENCGFVSLYVSQRPGTLNVMLSTLGSSAFRTTQVIWVFINA
jgi:hypothetical protein